VSKTAEKQLKGLLKSSLDTVKRQSKAVKKLKKQLKSRRE